MIGKLPQLLKHEGITSKETLRAYIDKHYGTSSDIPFRILKKQDLELDDENRIYNRTVEYENCIFDTPMISVQNATNVKFSNCIFCGDISIGQKHEDPNVDILFMRCLSLGRIVFAGLRAGASVALDTTNTPYLDIHACELRKLDLLACHLGYVSLDSMTIDEFDTYANLFELFELVTCKMERVKFDHRQVLINRLGNLLEEKSRAAAIRAEQFQVFNFISFPEMDEIFTESLRARQMETTHFLLEHTNIQLDRDAFAHTKYLLALASQKSTPGRILYEALGAFIKPNRIVALMVFVLMLYGIVFRVPFLRFNVSDASKDKPDVRALHIGEALYFSGVTFTTLGYGDITPNGIARFLAVSEALSGVTLLSAFVVALTRKYVD